MSRRITLVCWLVAFAAAASACGPKPGDPCDGDGHRCETSSSVLECRDGAWVHIPCLGPTGCQVVFGGVNCDITLNQEGDGCPTELEGTGYCRATPSALLVCQNRAVVKQSDCSVCTVGAQIVCTP